MRGLSRRLSLCAAALLVGACSGGVLQPDGRNITLPDVPQQTQVQPAAAREHQRILATYGGAYNDPKLEALVTSTVDRLVAASERPDLKYKVTILNSPAINAFALPNGQIYVTRGLLALANDTSEIASVLSHEMAHVIANHAQIREEQARQATMLDRVVTDVITDPQSDALALQRSSKGELASFSRAQEFEADGIGVGIAARAGYDPYGAVRFLTAMGRNADIKAGITERSSEFNSTHPATPERIRNARANARQFAAPGAGEHDRTAYLASLDGIIYGEDPADGFARGRRFIHPRLGFTFTAPEGFTLDNTAQAVLGVKDGGAEAMRLDVVKIEAEQSLTGYLSSNWIENVDKQSVEDTVIGGFPAATATARGDQWSFRLYAIRFGSDVYRFIYAARDLTPEIDAGFRASIETFRRLTLAEIEASKPLLLKIVAVKPGDTVETMAARHMAHLDHPLERFRALNGLAPGDRLKPGERIKIVVD